MKNIGMKIAMVAIFVNAPRFVIAFLAADGMRFPAIIEGAMLAITGIATGVVLTGGGAYIAHELIAMKGHPWSRAFMAVCWIALLAFSVIILAPMMAAMLANSELVSVLDTVTKRLQWSIASVVAIEVLTAGAMVAHAATQSAEIAVTASNKSSAWNLVSNALANRIASQLQPQATLQIASKPAQPAQPVQVASEVQEVQPIATDKKAQYLKLRASGIAHSELVQRLKVNSSTAASWWKRNSANVQSFATGD